MQKLKLATVLSAFGFGMMGTGIEAAHALTVQCPNNMTATWVGGAFGHTTTFTRSMNRYFVISSERTSELMCTRSTSSADFVQEIVQLSPGAIPALCGGRATISGIAPTSGGVPPFGGFVFKSGRIDAVPTYNQSTGRCQLDLPVRGLVTSVSVSEKCTPTSLSTWDCPSSAHSLSTSPAGEAEGLSRLLQESPALYRVLSQYDAFAKPRFATWSFSQFQSTAHATIWPG
ncbi:MAG: hypothetical protein ABI895_16940 [Deltaproteobacteria bacterium]